MTITLENTAKRFHHEWIFRGVNYSFTPDTSYAIVGRNGSGKSTLLQILAGNLLPSAGTIHYAWNQQEIAADHIFRHLSLVAPYQELIEEFSVREMLRFHFSFKPVMNGYSIRELIDLAEFQQTGSKPIRQFSSGMKQRVKLVCAVLSDTPLLLLDEPVSNLDNNGITWYRKLIDTFSKNRTIIICSNLHQQETEFCKETLKLEDYK